MSEKSQNRRWIIGADIGGTFTDVMAIDEAGTVNHAKGLTDHSDPAFGVIRALEVLADKMAMGIEDLLSNTYKFAHGTTITVNAVIQRQGARTGLITTKGFGDHLVVMNAQRGRGLPKSERRDLARVTKPAPLVPISLTREVTERVDFKGRVVVQLDEDEARTAVRSLVSERIEAIAVSLLWSFQNPSHEQLIGRIIEEEAPGVFYTLSSDLFPVIGEYERTLTTVLNSFLAPSLARYVEKLESELSARGLKHPYMLMQSFGGLIPASEAPREAVTTLVSGLAGGVIGAKTLGELLDFPNIITADMGGTSFEVGMVSDGEPLTQVRPLAPRLGPHVGRWTLSMPALDITAIGSGGGSIAWLDDGVLKVGPISAQAEPGPACYGLGGTRPTVTDADLVLGYVNADATFSGNIKLDVDLAINAIQRDVAGPLGMSVLEAARGIVDVANSQMADLLRKLTIERGYDPRDFVLVAFGGAGPIHLGAYGPLTGVRRMLVPGRGIASAFSALGVAMADVRRSYSLSRFIVEPYDPDAIEELFGGLELRGRETLRKWGIHPDQMVFSRSADMRFGGQSRTVSVPWPPAELDDAALATAMSAFIKVYESTYGRNTASLDAGSEITTFRLEAIGKIPRPRLSATGRPTVALRNEERQSQRSVCFPRQDAPTLVDVFDGNQLSVGQEIVGPALIDYEGTTVVVYPNLRASVDEFLDVVLEEVK